MTGQHLKAAPPQGERALRAGGLVSLLVAALLLSAPVSAQDAASPPATEPAAGTPATVPAAQTTPAPASAEPSSPAPAAVAPSASTPGVAPAPGAATAPADAAPAPSTATEGTAPAATASAPTEPLPSTEGSQAPVSADPTAAPAELDVPHDLSAWGMFMAADWIVKSVMIGLAFASVVTWTIWLAKVLELVGARRRAQGGVRRLNDAAGLPATDELAGSGWTRGPVAAMVRAATAERDRSAGLPADGVKERVATALHRIEARAGRRMARGTGLLATIGSTAPFVGLFGTVWGIMNSFIGISKANTTNLAVVAPGIAEALLATAIGLVAAIPAVIIYNVFARAIAGYKAVLADASAITLQHLSRDLDRAKGGAPVRTATSARIAAE